LVTTQRKIQSLYNIEKSIAIKNKKIDFSQPDMEGIKIIFKEKEKVF
jgi:hypothetical protein